jgi:hypothetical protein
VFGGRAEERLERLPVDARPRRLELGVVVETEVVAECVGVETRRGGVRERPVGAVAVPDEQVRPRERLVAGQRPLGRRVVGF